MRYLPATVIIALLASLGSWLDIFCRLLWDHLNDISGVSEAASAAPENLWQSAGRKLCSRPGQVPFRYVAGDGADLQLLTQL